MKKISFLLSLFLIVCITVFAQTRRGAIQIKLRDNKMLTLKLDGRHFKKYGNVITIDDLPQGMHELKVYYFYPASDPAYKGLRDNRSHASLAYKGRLHIDGDNMYYCTVDATYKTMSIRESRTVFIDNTEKTYPINTITIFSDEAEGSNSYEDKDNWDDRKSDDRSNVQSYYKEKNRINNAQLNTLKSAVEDRMSSSDKVDVIEDFLKGKKMMSDEVITIMGWLRFENNKLEVAKLCYDKVLDPENYLLVGKQLTFQSSKRELDAFINGNDKNDDYDVEYRKDRPAPKPKPILEEKKSGGVLQTADLNGLGKSVRDKTGDSDKQKFMKEYLSSYTVSSEQVATMLDWFAFEGTKLEFVKWAYGKMSDKTNVSKLKSKFNFSSSKKSIDDLISGGK